MASIDDKERLIKEIDEDFDITFNPHTESYLITHKGNHFQTIPYGDFTAKTLEGIRKVVYLNRNGDMLKHIDEANDKIHADNQRIQDDMIEQTAKDIAKPMYDLFR